MVLVPRIPVPSVLTGWAVNASFVALPGWITTAAGVALTPRPAPLAVKL